MPDHLPPLDDQAEHQAGSEIDARLRAAGERLRATAPEGAPNAAMLGSSASGGPKRAWYLGAAAAAVAAAVIAVIALPGGGDETIRQTPADSPAPADPTLGPGADTTYEPAPGVTPPSDGSEPPSTQLPASPIQLIEDVAARNWDGDRGRCFTLAIEWPGAPRENPMCVTGRQLDHGVDAYVSGAEYAWRWSATWTDDGEVGALSGGGVGVDADFAPEPPTALEPLARCGPPTHEMPADRWVMVSHCADGAALYTLLRSTPDSDADYLVGGKDGETHETVLLDARDVDTGAGAQQVIALSVPGPIVGAPISCIVVVPEADDRWIEGCAESESSGFDRLFLVDGSPWSLEWSEGGRLTPLTADASVRTNGCSSPTAELLVAVDEFIGTGMVSAMACAAPVSAFERWAGDRAVAVIRPSVLLTDGPRDGLLLMLERSGDGRLEVVDAGTGIDPDPWPLSIPPVQWISQGDDDLLPTLDVTAMFREAIPGAGSPAEMSLAISQFLTATYPTEGGPSHSMVSIAPLPLVIAPNVTYFDDSVGPGSFAIWLTDIDGDVMIERAYVTDTCRRGVTELDGRRVCV